MFLWLQTQRCYRLIVTIPPQVVLKALAYEKIVNMVIYAQYAEYVKCATSLNPLHVHCIQLSVQGGEEHQSPV